VKIDFGFVYVVFFWLKNWGFCLVCLVFVNGELFLVGVGEFVGVIGVWFLGWVCCGWSCLVGWRWVLGWIVLYWGWIGIVGWCGRMLLSLRVCCFMWGLVCWCWCWGMIVWFLCWCSSVVVVRSRWGWVFRGWVVFCGIGFVGLRYLLRLWFWWIFVRVGSVFDCGWCVWGMVSWRCWRCWLGRWCVCCCFFSVVFCWRAGWWLGLGWLVGWAGGSWGWGLLIGWVVCWYDYCCSWWWCLWLCWWCWWVACLWRIWVARCGCCRVAWWGCCGWLLVWCLVGGFCWWCCRRMRCFLVCCCYWWGWCCMRCWYWVGGWLLG